VNQKKIVARALSEVLKIVGALGIVNVFTIAMLNRSLIAPRPDMPAHERVFSFDHFQIVPDVRNLDNPDWAALACGLALLLMFIRFIYGSIILIDGDYGGENVPAFEGIQKSDLISICTLMFLFPLLSFYGGAGRLGAFAVFLAFAVFVDSIAMIFGKKEENINSIYYRERISWSKINGATAGLLVTGLLFSWLIEKVGGHVVGFDTLGGIFIAVYCLASFCDLKINLGFYLGLRSAVTQSGERGGSGGEPPQAQPSPKKNG
jgi:hypothetical protein